MNIENILKKFYQEYDEENRLSRDKVHEIEFITTTKYIDNYLNDNSSILEVGAGTGAYSLYYASKGYQVNSLELVQENIDILKSKIKKNMNIRVCQGNAVDLSMYDDESFDVTLVLGPMYHIFDKKDQIKALNEAIRVTKKSGHILVAYILADYTMLDWGFLQGNLYSNMGKMVDNDYKVINREEYVFYLNYVSDIKKQIKKLKEVKLIKLVATDGIGRIIRNVVNNMNEDEYKHYINYHLSICEREDLMGYSGHILSILEKK